ncbi:MAG: hypothetical protein EZS28_018140 [Streblomastix strix]|uniref:Uncharacterized protein n=1 Tax=Streblomastix strix TaxID=222440 RepID=A0A5J4VV16_9EUKA|nr:MAG: hypothetical protein EZS28_018140 [Streblomastix strix]
MAEVLRSASIHPQSFCLSRQEFFDQPVSQMTSDGQRYIGAPLGARGAATCSMVQSCQVNWQITIPPGRLALQLNLAADNSQADWTHSMEAGDGTGTTQPFSEFEHIKLWLSYSTACGPFQQFAICKDKTKLWETTIYAREQAVISSNSLSDLCTRNSVSVSPLESVVEGKRHCGIFLDIPVAAFKTAGLFNYLIPYPITFREFLTQINQILFSTHSQFLHVIMLRYIYSCGRKISCKI